MGKDQAKLEIARIHEPWSVLKVRDHVAALGPLSTAFNVAWPAQPGFVSDGVFVLAPGEWGITRAPQEVRDICAVALSNMVFLINDLSDGQITWRMSGDGARELLARGCSLDFHAQAFLSGRCAQTLFAQVPALIARVDESDSFLVRIDVSYGVYFEQWLHSALRGIGAFPLSDVRWFGHNMSPAAALI